MLLESNVVITITDASKFRYLWMKNVKNFRSSCHCAGCLVGEYAKQFGVGMKTDQSVTLNDTFEGDLLYFCGVATPYVWSNNMHLAGRVKMGAVASVDLHNGGKLSVENLEQITISDATARELYPEKKESFLTCRNFQFGAQVFNSQMLKKSG